MGEKFSGSDLDYRACGIGAVGTFARAGGVSRTSAGWQSKIFTQQQPRGENCGDPLNVQLQNQKAGPRARLFLLPKSAARIIIFRTICIRHTGILWQERHPWPGFISGEKSGGSGITIKMASAFANPSAIPKRPRELAMKRIESELERDNARALAIPQSTLDAIGKQLGNGSPEPLLTYPAVRNVTNVRELFHSDLRKAGV